MLTVHLDPGLQGYWATWGDPNGQSFDSSPFTLDPETQKFLWILYNGKKRKTTNGKESQDSNSLHSQNMKHKLYTAR